MPIQALVVCSPLISDKRQVEWSARNRRGSRWNRLVRSEMLGQNRNFCDCNWRILNDLNSRNFRCKLLPSARRSTTKHDRIAQKARKHLIFR
jgi:hypothetical protein